MSATWRSVLLSVAAALLLAAVMLFVIFRFFLPWPEAEEGDEPQFVIGVWEDKVAVFESGKDYPMQVFDVFVQALPQEQQQQVRVGIPAEDADRLSVLLEDYTS